MKYMTEDQVTHIYQAILAQVPRAVAAETAGPLTAALESLRQLKDDDSDLFSVAVVDNGFSAAADELASAAKASPQAIAVLIRILKKLPGETPFYYYVRRARQGRWGCWRIVSATYRNWRQTRWPPI